MKSIHSTYYFLGIGGVGMSALARLCHLRGAKVFGYDRVKSSITQELEREGIRIEYNDEVTSIPDEVLDQKASIIYTAAIPSSHPQLNFFIREGYSVKKRALFLAELCQGKTTLAVGGTHGKTTTTAFLTHMFAYSKLPFTSFMGGFFKNNSSNLIRTGDDFMIVEADEYDRSFLHLHPTVAGITSIDSDHLDIYKTPQAFEKAFAVFASQVKQQLIIAHGLPFDGLTYGVNVDAVYRIENVQKFETGYLFDIKTPKEAHRGVKLNQLGAHNLSNMLCALAMADQVGISVKKALESLESFPGVYRRLNVFKWKGAWLIDDYAHHQTEIKSVLETVQSFFAEQKKCVVFQPHLFSRTQDFYKEFIEVLSQFDEVVLMEIYPAREEPIEGISSKNLLRDLNHPNKKLIEKTQLAQTIEASEATVFALLGAGDIGEQIQFLKSKIEVE